MALTTAVTAPAPADSSQAAKTCHIADPLLRTERMPHIWCPSCGIGATVNCFVAALDKSGIDKKKIAVVSGIGCTGRVAGYVRLDSFHTTHGRPIPFATGLKLGNPELKVIVYSGDGDLTGIGGNHFIHAARKNMDLTVICVNNFNYAMTGGQASPTTPLEARASTAPYGCFEPPFNLPYLAETCGAVYVARWTALHIRQTTKAMTEAMLKKGFSFIEIIAPCPTLYARLNKFGEGLDELKFYMENSELKNGAETKTVGIDFRGKIAVGKFVDKEAPTFLENMNRHLSKVLKDKYVWWGPKAENNGKK
ncbi:MAG: 2-oxoacid:ferredoxin oxidoreductase subunit beta [Elusimicrobia bacterium]|nr:2-oxoacid:ferredoxin oxidoreductase subunit beta [Elusimicrobiota bacterium]